MARFDWWRIVPGFWFQNSETSDEWDEVLNRLIDDYEPELSFCVAKFGNVNVWVANWPYAYGSPYHGYSRVDVLPRVSTRKRLKKVVLKAQAKQLMQLNEIRKG